MIEDQMNALTPFPDSHPKKKVFLDNLKEGEHWMLGEKILPS